MFQKHLCFFFFIVSFFTSTAQLQVAHMDEAILSTSDRTYLTFGQGIGNYKTPYGIKPLNPLIFEGQISPDFFLRLSKKRTVGLAVFPKIIIRMFNQPSMPVKTPSYMPSILFYHQLNIPFTKQLFRFFSSDEQMAFMTYRAIHHSNGQEGNYYLTGTDSVNYRNGNFSTNAVEIAFSWSAVDSGRVGKSFANGRIAYERQLDIERETELRHTYYYDKISLESRFIYSEKVKAYIKYSVMWGTAKFRPRNSVDLFLAFKPSKKLSNFSIFMRGYIGPDYYNLYYENMLRTITLGIIADPLSIPVFQKVKNKK
ncbi:MAG: hypothetical protein IPP64_02270 [Bacteroidetes bacterium]|nr:hypothetical protein [Bacteroidota bacterium]